MVHYLVQNSPPPVPIIDQMITVHNFTPDFSEIHYNIVFPSSPRSSQ